MQDPLHCVGTTLADRYQVEALVGEGGMAFVYRAHDLKHDRTVALKTLRPEFAAALGDERFHREIHFAARLQHPNILPLYDSGAANGLLFYVMPLVEGESLRRRLDREKQLPLEDTVRIAGEAADALGYAHEHGIIHRDIKPENILLIGGHTLVADFGIAKAIEAARGESLTQTGLVVGTPLYMSPEQGSGSASADPRSDQYSLACVVYEMLTGVPPFSGPTPLALIARHSMDQVPSIRTVRHSIPGAMEAVILRALEKVPADRFPDMAHFAAALRAAATEVAGPVPFAPAGRRSRARLSVWSILGPAILVVATGLWMLQKEPAGRRRPVESDADARHIAVRYFETAPDQDSLRYVADALTEGLIDELRQVPGLDVVSRGGSALYRGAGLPRDSIARALGVGTLVEGEVARRADGLEVMVRLVDAASNAEFRRKGFVVPGNDVLASTADVNAAVADFLRERLGEEIVLRHRQAGTQSGAAWAFLQRGQGLARQADSLARARGFGQDLAGQFARADSLFGLARATDPTWVEPLVQLGASAYLRSRLVNANPVSAGPWITRGLAYADSALRLDPASAAAYELRGTARYWGYLLGLDPEASVAQQHLAQARADLEKSVGIDPHRASAWASLSHLHYQPGMGGVTEVLLAARRAYEEDAYLASADKVLSRLFLGAYDVGNQVDARHWCRVGARRFPSRFDFVECRLLLMTMPDAQPEVGLAWKLRDSALAAAAKPDSAFQDAGTRLWLAAILARAGLAESAQHVLAATRIARDIDPLGDLYLRQAFVLTVLGDREQAFAALRRRLALNRGAAIDLRSGWWFTELAGDPRFGDLTGPGH